MLEKLKESVCRANLALVQYGLVVLTWGNVSALSEDGKYVVIKPSGIPYESMKPEHMVITDLEGTVCGGTLRPSTDLLTHLELYRAFPKSAVLSTHIPAGPQHWRRRNVTSPATEQHTPTISMGAFPAPEILRFRKFKKAMSAAPVW